MSVTITRTPWIDDDGTGTTGTIINNAVKTELYNQIDEALAAVGVGASGDFTVTGALVVAGTSLFHGRVSVPAGINSGTGSVAAPSGIPVTLFAVTTGAVSMYLIGAAILDIGDATNFTASAIVVVEGATARMVAQNAPAMALSLAGLNVQATQQQGTTLPITYSQVRVY